MIHIHFSDNVLLLNALLNRGKIPSHNQQQSADIDEFNKNQITNPELDYNVMAHVFTYGSLMFDKVWSSLVSKSYEHLQGTLFGFERKCIRNEQYPAIVPGSITASVDGVLYFNVSGDDLLRLDAFEGSYYTRQTVQIQTDNNIFNGEAYILGSSYHHIVTPEAWDPKRLADEGLEDFIATYFGFDE